MINFPVRICPLLSETSDIQIVVFDRHPFRLEAFFLETVAIAQNLPRDELVSFCALDNLEDYSRSEIKLANENAKKLPVVYSKNISVENDQIRELHSSSGK